MQTRNGFGEGASPALPGDTLVVNWDHEGETSSSRWTRGPARSLAAARDEPTTWATPLDRRTCRRPRQVVATGTQQGAGYDLQRARRSGARG